MHERLLKQMRQRIRTRNYVVSLHAAEEMEDDGYTILDAKLGPTGKLVIITVYRP